MGGKDNRWRRKNAIVARSLRPSLAAAVPGRPMTMSLPVRKTEKVVILKFMTRPQEHRSAPVAVRKLQLRIILFLQKPIAEK